MADREITPDLKSRQSKWSWPHLASVQARKPGFQSPDRPSSSRSVSDKSQKSPSLSEHKTPSQTSLPLSAIPSDTSSIKSMGIAEDNDPNVDHSFGDIHKPSSLSSRSSSSISSGHGTIRAEEPQPEQIPQKAKEVHLEEKVSIGGELNSELDTQNNHKEKPVRGQELGSEGLILESRDPHSHVEIPQEKELNSEGEIQKVQDPHSDIDIPHERELDSEGEIQKIQDPHSDVEIPQEKGLDSKGEIQKTRDPHSNVEVPQKKELDLEREIQSNNDLHVRWKQPIGNESGPEEKIRRGHDPYLVSKSQEAKGQISEKAKAAEESGSEIESRSEGEPRSEKNLQRADGQRLKEVLRRTTNIRPTVNSRETQPIAPEVPQGTYICCGPR